MASVEALADAIIAREGGYVNDPDDPGGPTKYGVTLTTLRRVRGDRRLGASDVPALTASEARDIFVQHYFHAPRIAKLPGALHASVFDMYVNAGAAAVRILQRLLSDMGQRIAVDGLIGPQTIGAAQAAHAAAPEHLSDAYGIARRNYYYRLGDGNPRLRKFARRRDGRKGGWITRAEEFITTRYHLTDAEHARRVAAWV